MHALRILQVPRILRILLVDDNRDHVHALAALLTGFGHLVDHAYDGVSAVAIAKRFRPDIVLLDLGMPGKNGFEVCAELKKAGPAASRLTVIALTAYNNSDYRQRAEEVGFDDYVVKPPPPDFWKSMFGSARNGRPLRH